jgi:hypothetical protein
MSSESSSTHGATAQGQQEYNRFGVLFLDSVAAFRGRVAVDEQHLRESVVFGAKNWCGWWVGTRRGGALMHNNTTF